MKEIAATSGKPKPARERLLEAAKHAILAKGLAATSIEELIVEVGISKSGFVYHFGDKNGLAKALMERFLEEDRLILEGIFRRGEELDEDPLHGFLVGLQLLIEMLQRLPAAHPGCIAASFCYQDQLVSREIRDLNLSAASGWRRQFRTRLGRIAERYPQKIKVDLDELADTAWILIEGGIVLSRMMQDPGILPAQIRVYRDFIRGVFQGE
ncbi:MAG TPA: TetR/AcrR family transcriptional regulator [Dongiaceae bacterium]|jgi:AcrR family transcriptional regulator|nr:TetR/AcrR family transcriptional regulator [Dongiaceae bacterium]